jgi:3-hydroxy-9,10-secoandrosta-1,3,5(10)-triene-9,17-dione monooxygenase
MEDEARTAGGRGSAASPGGIAPPEPDLDPETLIARAAALRPLLREQQDEADQLGHYTDEVHAALLEAGLYRAVQPRLFGGYECDIPTYLKIIAEISRGHPSSGWCYTLAASHALYVAARWSAEAQRELFGPDGDFRAPHRAPPAGKFERVEGGYIVNGTWSYSSGIPVSTHFIGSGLLPAEDGGAPSMANFIVPREQVEVLSDWGGDRSLGMQGSGSNSVRLENVFVPDRYFVDASGLLTSDPSGKGTPGTELHGNPMFLGVVGGVYQATFGGILVGTARAALEEYEQVLRTRTVFNMPHVKRIDDAESQRAFGKALQLTQAAEAITIRVGQLYMEQCERWRKTGAPITIEDTLELWGTAQEGCLMACRAVEEMFHSSHVLCANKGQRLQRYFRDVQMYLIHPSSQPSIGKALGQANLGLEVEMFAPPKAR